jgi:hypothetical protein
MYIVFSFFLTHDLHLQIALKYDQNVEGGCLARASRRRHTRGFIPPQATKNVPGFNSIFSYRIPCTLSPEAADFARHN